MHASSLQLRLLSVAAFLTALGACTEPDDPPEGPTASVTAGVDPRVTNVGFDALITVRSRNSAGALSTETMVGTVAENAAAVGNLRAAGADPATGSDSASAVPGEDGSSTFQFRCPAVGEATVTFSDSNGSRPATVECIAAPRAVAVDTSECNTSLQADGFSTCRVTVSIPSAGADSHFAVGATATDATGTEVETAVLQLFSATGTRPAQSTLIDQPLVGGQGSFFVHSPARNAVLTLALTVTDELGSSGTGTVSIKPFVDSSSLTIDATDRIAAGASTNVTLTGRTFNGSVAANETVELTIVGASTQDAGCLSGTTATLDAAGLCTFAIAADAGRTDPITIDGLLALPDATTRAASKRIGIAVVGEVTISRAPAGIINLLPEGAAAVPGTNFPTEQEFTIELKKATISGDELLSQATVVATVDNASRSLITIDDFDPASAGDTDDRRVGTVVNPANGIVKFTVRARNALAIGAARVNVTVTDANPVSGVPPTSRHVVEVALQRQRALSSILFVSSVPAQLGVPGGHLPRSSTVTFRVFDEAGVAIANEAVGFTMISATDARVDAAGQTGADGSVSVQVQAGSVATPITIRATVVSRPDLTATSTPIAIIGGLPSATFSSVRCETRAAFPPFDTDCTVVLADQFSNRVATPYQVQFRAEGGNIPAVGETNAGGSSTVQYVHAEPGPGGADVLQWSHARVPPPSPTNTAGAIQQAFPGCFDRTSRTSCDLEGICRSSNPSISAHCPMPPSQLTGASLCFDDISADAFTALELGGDPDSAVHEAWEAAVFGGFDPDAERQFLDYQDTYRACGHPLSCLVPDRVFGLEYDAADNCPINPGCLDFSTATECPQEGLLDIMASVPGQEGYDDVNGNGVRDATETFVDYPEPFLDKNSSCSYDDLNHLSSQSRTPGRLAPSEVVRLSDQYIETDRDSPTKFFGFLDPNGGPRLETNGVFDEQTDIFMKTSILLLRGAPRLQFGLEVSASSCGDGNTPINCGVFATTSLCTETARTPFDNKALLESCLPAPGEFREGDAVTFSFRWSDDNGNCPANDFDALPIVDVDVGVLTLTQTDLAPFSDAECGTTLGGNDVTNPERPWCEEHPTLGAGFRRLTATVTCGGLTGPQLERVAFELSETVKASRTIRISCPVCGDGLVEGEDEECDEGPNGGNGCTSTCLLDEP